jgi:VWFA-related protein
VSPLAISAQQVEPRPTFRGGVSRVAVAATVRDKRGRQITTLKAEDFALFVNGQPREILEFSRDTAPIAIGLLADVSGSMDIGDKRVAMREVTHHLVSALTPDSDQIGLFAFDRGLEEVLSLRPAPAAVLERLDGIKSYGRTSLFDAVADASRRLVESAGPRRAVVVLTDGYDNASQLTPGEVSGLASSIDVPVYVIVVVSPMDRSGDSSLIDAQLQALRDGPLGNLARWTGGDIMLPVTQAAISSAARQVVAELRHQYLMAFEPGGQSGWHPLELRTRVPNLTVRARSGYVVPAQAGSRQ